ncbi:hypothetical protein COCSUDRAFT_45131 [Coccomyxa subellipsoidea C-169]|uniref:Uncharacterized protein n=1 Tax=Coccomyxa subellipsoidea (strain C-169) TaxID=574566 RepID=I0YJR5_COCSC|nr:hypothetical protein COCSUDRAFT_45131 [Coccomyxa subellipsoidea C-169]EIE18634.1 hypothetical protein COCSUDRAFT_45131 [Coccomyxa subellipsoidea C-169]|eukprot:XP_005643178.1 hypothetical protein COCSUDRAFT_45131 [Coccomyxa subellipsoidea C-169]
MKTFAVALLALCLAVAVNADVCHYDCYKVDPAAGKTAKTALFQACGVTDYRFGSGPSNDLQGVYKQAPPAGCELAVCAHFPTQAAVDTYRNACEHPKPQYAVLNGKGAGRFDAACTTCAAS